MRAIKAHRIQRARKVGKRRRARGYLRHTGHEGK